MLIEDSVESLELSIDEEFRRLCPPLLPAEKSLLESSIKEEGCREALIAWNGKIVDGHNRYEICRRLNIKYDVFICEFESRDVVKDWILKNQLARRNLGRIQASVLRGQLYKQMRARNGGSRPKRYGAANKGDTSRELGKALGVCPSTIRWDVHIADAVEKLTEKARNYVLSPQSKARKQNVVDMSCLSPEDQDSVIEAIQSGKFTNLRPVILKLRPRAVKGEHSVRCKGCGAKLAPGVATCLACDIEKGSVAKRLAERTDCELDLNLDSEAAERLNQLRSMRGEQTELQWHADEIMGFIEKNECQINTKEHRLLNKLWTRLAKWLPPGMGRIRAEFHKQNET